MADQVAPTSPPPVESEQESSPPPSPPADWRAGFPEDLRTNATIQNASTPLDAAKMLIHAESLVGADKVPIPQKTWTDEQKRDFFNKIGCPEKGEDYLLPQDGLPQGMEIDTARIDAFRPTALRLGITDQQFAGLVRWQMEAQATEAQETVTMGEKAYEESTTELRTKWGDAYDQEVAFAQHAVNEFGGEELRDVLVETGLDNLPALVIAFNKVGKMIARDEIIGTGPRSLLHTPESAKIAIGEKQQDKDFMTRYMDESRPGHEAAVDEMWELQQRAYPEPAKTT